MKIPEFHSPEIRANVDFFLSRGKEWLESMGNFNEDLRNVEKLLKQFCVPSFYVTVIEDTRHEVLTFDPAGTLHWDDVSFRVTYSDFDDTRKPLAECAFNLRQHAINDKWLNLVIEEAADEMQKATEQLRKCNA